MKVRIPHVDSRIPCPLYGIRWHMLTHAEPLDGGMRISGKRSRFRLRPWTTESNASGISSPTCRQGLGLFEYGSRGLLLFVGGIAILTKHAPDQPTQIGADVLAQRPVDGDVATHGIYQFARDLARGRVVVLDQFTPDTWRKRGYREPIIEAVVEGATYQTRCGAVARNYVPRALVASLGRSDVSRRRGGEVYHDRPAPQRPMVGSESS